MACKAVGGTTELARLLSSRRPKPVSKASVSRWKRDGVPAEMCPDIEDLTGIRCEQLLPHVNWGALRKVPARKSSKSPEVKVA